MTEIFSSLLSVHFFNIFFCLLSKVYLYTRYLLALYLSFHTHTHTCLSFNIKLRFVFLKSMALKNPVLDYEQCFSRQAYKSSLPSYHYLSIYLSVFFIFFLSICMLVVFIFSSPSIYLSLSLSFILSPPPLSRLPSRLITKVKQCRARPVL